MARRLRRKEPMWSLLARELHSEHPAPLPSTAIGPGDHTLPQLQHYEAEQLWPPTLATQLTLHTHPHTHSLTHPQHTHPHTQALSHTHPYTHTSTHTPPHTPSHTHLHTYISSQTHVPSYTHTHTHKFVPVPELCSYLPQRTKKPGPQFLLHSPRKEGGSKEQRV